MWRKVLFLLLWASAGCGPIDLPSHELGQESLLVFRDFDAAPEALVDELDRMDALLGNMDLEGRERDRIFGLPSLTEEYRADVDVPEGIDDSHQIAMGMAASSRHDVGANMSAQSQADQACINSDTVTCHRRDALTDLGCFLDQSCDTWRTFNVIRIETIVVRIWLEAYVDFRWVTLPDGRMAVASRTWIEDAFLSDGGKTTWDQRFGVDVYIPDSDRPDRTRRWYATWLGGDVGGVGGGWVQRVLIGGMDEGFENPDDWLDGEDCPHADDECDFPT